MKKLSLFVFTFVLFAAVFANSEAFTIPKPINAKEIYLPVGNTGQKISLLNFSRLKPSEYEKLAGVKLNVLDRVNYKMAMAKLRRSIDKDGTIKNEKLAKLIIGTADSSKGFHLAGFALGFFLGSIGLLIAYLIKGNKKSNRIKWAWIGFGIGLLVRLTLILLFFRIIKI
jgi:hypothetical protein